MSYQADCNGDCRQDPQAVGTSVWPYGKGRVVGEEVVGHQRETEPMGWHYWPILGSGYMMPTQSVPGNDISVAQGAVLLDPCPERVGAIAHHSMAATGIALIGFLLRHPKLVVDIGIALHWRVVARQQ